MRLRILIWSNLALFLFPLSAESADKNWSACRSSDPQLVVKACSQIIATQPSKVDKAAALYSRGWAHNQLNEFDLAIADLTGSIELNPKNADAFTARAQAHYLKQHLDLAIADYNQALSLGADPPTIYFSLSNARFFNKDYDGAIADLDQAIKLKPDYADAFSQRGFLNKLRSHYALAISDYTEAIRLKPATSAYYAGRGDAHSAVDHFQEAFDDYNRAVQLDKNNAFNLESRAELYLVQGEFEAASKDFDEAIRLKPEVAFFYRKRGKMNYQLGDYDKAIADYDKAISSQPNFDNYRDRAEAYQRKGNYDLAIADRTIVVEANPVAESYEARGRTYAEKGDHARAITDFDRAIALNAKRYNARIGRGGAHWSQGNLELAEKDFQQVLDITSPDVSDLIVKFWGRPEVVDLFAQWESRVEATELLRELQRFKLERTSTPGEVKLEPDFADNLEINKLESAGRIEEALRIEEQLESNSQRDSGEENPSYALALHIKSRLLWRLGKLPEAEATNRRALAIREKVLGPNHPDVSDSLNNIALNLMGENRAAEAEPLARRSLAIRQKAYGDDHLRVAISWENLSFPLVSLGRPREAEDALRHALAIREKALGVGDPRVAFTLTKLANLYRTEGRLDDAESLYRRALAIVQNTTGLRSFITAEFLHNLTSLLYAKRDFVTARDVEMRVLEIQEKNLGPNDPALATALHGLAVIYSNIRQAEESIPLLQRALVLLKKKFGDDDQAVAGSLAALATQYQQQKRFGQAEPLFKRVLEIYDKALPAEHALVANIHTQIARLYDDTDRPQEALPHHRQASAIVLARKQHGLGKAPELEGVNERFIADLYRLAQGQVNSQALIDEAFQVAQQENESVSGAALAQMALRFSAGDSSLAQGVRNQQDVTESWKRANAELLSAFSKPPKERSTQKEAQLRDEIASLEIRLDEGRSQLEKEFPEYASLSNPKALSQGEVKQLLRPNEALVSYAITDQTLYVWVVSKERVEWHKISLEAYELAEKVGRLRGTLDIAAVQEALTEGKGQTAMFDVALAHELESAVFSPIENGIRGKSRLLIVPAGALTSLPFQVLVLKQPEKLPTKPSDYRGIDWLVKTYAVTTLPSVGSLKSLRMLAKGASGRNPLIGYGDPVFKDGEESGTTRRKVAERGVTRAYTEFFRGTDADLEVLRNGLPQLPETRQELETVAKKLGVPASEIHLGKDASETAVKHTKLDDYRIVYFATHGLVAGDIKTLAEPALALSLPSSASDEDDGLLTASEVAQLKLNSDWVVLSACNTAAGDKPGAEALSGLARAFFYAGARALLVSHWPVGSAAATRLTTSIFDALKDDPSMGRSEALRRAMVAMIEDETYEWNAYPAFWAPFVVVGEGGAY